MYRLYRRTTLADSDVFWLDYEWADSFDNTEWRPCVEHFVNEVAIQGHKVVALPSPEFVSGEDSVEVAYLVNGKRTVFSSDHLLSLIVIESEDPHLIGSIWDDIGNKVGWVRE
ncbi:hypothetical protein [Massilia suwonensis]|uniref:Uncharacterized protein n=1 Tax=Massilia suwonensis TaxID=648895 RepID=A0ABW0MT48_9BURK